MADALKMELAEDFTHEVDPKTTGWKVCADD